MAEIPSLRVCDRSVPVEIHPSPRARRLALRLDTRRGVVKVMVPNGVGPTEAARFVQRHHGWVAARLAALPPARPFVVGATVPILGVDHVIRHDPGCLGRGRREGGELVVGGGLEHLERRVRTLLIAEARHQITGRARAFTETLGVRLGAITLRDTSSRWGSCSATGRLSFSWRLILAPDAVLTYLVAHEVAHLREMNHSVRFWRLVQRLTPEAESARAWLRRHGAALHRYGEQPPENNARPTAA